MQWSAHDAWGKVRLFRVSSGDYWEMTAEEARQLSDKLLTAATYVEADLWRTMKKSQKPTPDANENLQNGTPT